MSAADALKRRRKSFRQMSGKMGAGGTVHTHTPPQIGRHSTIQEIPQRNFQKGDMGASLHHFRHVNEQHG